MLKQSKLLAKIATCSAKPSFVGTREAFDESQKIMRADVDGCGAVRATWEVMIIRKTLLVSWLAPESPAGHRTLEVSIAVPPILAPCID